MSGYVGRLDARRCVDSVVSTPLSLATSVELGRIYNPIVCGFQMVRNVGAVGDTCANFGTGALFLDDTIQRYKSFLVSS